MSKIFRKQAGSVHVVIIVILVLIIVSTLGFIFWNNFIKKSPVPIVSKTTNQHTTIEKKKNGLVTLADSDMIKYINYDRGFEFLIPKQTYSSNACEGITTRHDNYGNVVHSFHYQVSDGTVSMTVIENNDEYTIVSDHSVVLGGEQYSENQGYSYTVCNVVLTTPDILTRSIKSDLSVEDIPLEQRSFVVKDANNEGAAQDVSRELFGDSTGTVSWIADPTQSDRQVGGFTYTPNSHLTGGFAYKLWYYPSKKKVVFYVLGQSVSFQHPDQSDQYYDIVSTFKFSTE